MFKGISSNKPT